ncbi:MULTISPECIES: lytic murein transglycosylase [unclassified Rhodococcus (in: high G+C Gram-positive bacteria)]|uniref:lytic transglycosylase domain-containing protein n=1 Tax=unclassified Rhodococcus (in: high G+C Gram-positive bacteria) TaxID=192944 RepID=UPI0016398DC2|nr:MULTISPECIES: lytic murein transglycosylase [unclassified Rhodococcus (in: high G+C Gram-positive bacteria)]MBC2643207.1 lytic murein transglycosylase [Rhodococcus sp. 3A]MBC2892052.1 lytic murein transglycosylase [Rhodococcus sp. 4CII]
MGRHNKKTDSHIRRNSVIALTGLVPIGLITAANTAGAAPKVPFLSTSSSSEAADVAEQAPAAVPEAAESITPVAETAAEAAPAAQEAAAPPALAPVQATPPLPTSIAQGALGIPAINVAAYQNAERMLAVEQPNCHMYWTLIAGIGRVESTHAYDGKADDKGNMLEPVLGPVLDGSLGGNNVIRDTDGGKLDGDPNYDRAVGPTQFLPETWNHYAGDGNGDGVADPQNLFDSALTTGKYLCDGGLDVRDPIQAAKAVHRYNNSAAYVANVLAWSAGYSSGIIPAAADLPRIH